MKVILITLIFFLNINLCAKNISKKLSIEEINKIINQYFDNCYADFIPLELFATQNKNGGTVYKNGEIKRRQYKKNKTLLIIVKNIPENQKPFKYNNIKGITSRVIKKMTFIEVPIKNLYNKKQVIIYNRKEQELIRYKIIDH